MAVSLRKLMAVGFQVSRDDDDGIGQFHTSMATTSAHEEDGRIVSLEFMWSRPERGRGRRPGARLGCGARPGRPWRRTVRDPSSRAFISGPRGGPGGAVAPFPLLRNFESGGRRCEDGGQGLAASVDRERRHRNGRGKWPDSAGLMEELDAAGACLKSRTSLYRLATEEKRVVAVSSARIRSRWSR